MDNEQMTVRDRVACAALSGMCGKPEFWALGESPGQRGWSNGDARHFADLAYEMADAMLEARAGR